jgi:DNA (cytosine-5)-methyltransferase 3A
MALQEAGIPVTKYYSSEVDKHAVSMSNILYPDTIQLGDVRNIDVNELDKVDILIGGSPCQSFSFAGKMKGMSTKCEKEILSLEQYLELKEQNFEFEGQSYLFWEYVRIYTELRLINPEIKFFLENVLMVEKWERLISKTLDVNPIMINSALLSAQNRKRLYWTNIGMAPAGLFGEMTSTIKQPDDKGILLKHILEENVAEKYYLSDKALKYLDKDTTNGWSDRLSMLNYDDKDKAGCITANHSKGVPYNMIKCVAMRGRNPENSKSRESGVGCIKFGRTEEAKNIRKTNMQEGIDYTPFAEKTIVDIDFEKMNTLITSTSKDNLVMQINPSKESGGKQPYQQNRVYHTEGISPALSAHKSDLLITENYIQWEGNGYNQDNRAYYPDCKSATLDIKPQRQKVLLNNEAPWRIRRLTPRECGRLQTVPEHLLDKMLSSGISDTQLYKMFGNGWTVSVIAHIFSYLNNKS